MEGRTKERRDCGDSVSESSSEVGGVVLGRRLKNMTISSEDLKPYRKKWGRRDGGVTLTVERRLKNGLRGKSTFKFDKPRV